MKKILTTVALTLVASLGTIQPARADSIPYPDAPACITYQQYLYWDWEATEENCDLTFDSAERPFVTWLENILGIYIEHTEILNDKISTQQAQIDWQKKEIRRQRHQIARLRHRLANRH